MKKISILFISIFLVSCNSRTYDEISPKVVTPTLVTYNNDVKIVMQNSCVSCHSSSGAASYYPLSNYSEVKNSIDAIIERIEKPIGDPLKMPQGGSLSSAQIELIKKWKTDGLKE